MKSKNIQLFIAASFLITLMACTGNTGKFEILTERIQYDVPIISGDPQLDWWINNIEGSNREPFLKRIMEAAANGDVRVFDYFNNPLTPQQILSIGSDTIYQTLLRNYPPYDEYDTMIVKSISYRDIVKIRFMEEWTWNRKSLEMNKKIVGIGPVIQKEIAGENFNQLLFWIYLDDRYPVK